MNDNGNGKHTLPKLCPKIILEGTRLTNKTEIAFKLNEHPDFVGEKKYRYHSPIVSAEWCGFTNFPWGRGLINFNEEEESLALETYRTWVKLFELQKYYSWIVDRFHLSTMIFQNRSWQSFNFKWLERRIEPLGFAIVLCTRTPESFAEAREERIRISGNPSQYDDLQVFIDEQDRYRELAEKSILPFFEVDVTSGDLDHICSEITGWYTENKLLGFCE